MARRCWSCAPEKNCSPCWARTRPDGLDPAGTAGGRLRGVDGEAVPLVRGGAAKRVLPADQGPAQGSARAGRTDQGNDRGRALVRIPNGGWLAGDEQERCSGYSSSRASRRTEERRVGKECVRRGR